MIIIIYQILKFMKNINYSIEFGKTLNLYKAKYISYINLISIIIFVIMLNDIERNKYNFLNSM